MAVVAWPSQRDRGSIRTPWVSSCDANVVRRSFGASRLNPARLAAGRFEIPKRDEAFAAALGHALMASAPRPEIEGSFQHPAKPGGMLGAVASSRRPSLWRLNMFIHKQDSVFTKPDISNLA